jgi:hypothetical protein
VNHVRENKNIQFLLSNISVKTLKHAVTFSESSRVTVARILTFFHALISYDTHQFHVSHSNFIPPVEARPCAAAVSFMRVKINGPSKF